MRHPPLRYQPAHEALGHAEPVSQLLDGHPDALCLRNVAALVLTGQPVTPLSAKSGCYTAEYTPLKGCRYCSWQSRPSFTSTRSKTAVLNCSGVRSEALR